MSFQQQMRKIIIEQSKRANVGHIGSALSVTDLIATLYDKVLRFPNPSFEDRDRFILSKGHAALALYAALFLKNFLSFDDLNSYCSTGTLLGVHPEHHLKPIDFSTGSLGQGVSFGVGAALAAKLQSSNRKIYVLMSDAECNEGVVWEAIMFAAHHQLNNLFLIIDDNKQQAIGYTKDILNIQPLSEKFLAFGWDVKEINGHEPLTLQTTIHDMQQVDDKPHVIIANTTFGKGISFMESKIAWHYLPLNDEQYQLALSEIGAAS